LVRNLYFIEKWKTVWCPLISVENSMVSPDFFPLISPDFPDFDIVPDSYLPM